MPISTSTCIRPRSPRSRDRDQPTRRPAAHGDFLHRRRDGGQQHRRRWTINITFSGPIDPSTLTASTVQLEELGITPRHHSTQFINLSGKLTYNSSTDTLVINLAAAGLTLATDAYQIILFGSGSPVHHQPAGHRARRRELQSATPRPARSSPSPRATATPAATSTTRSSSTPRRRRSSPGSLTMSRPATPTSSATTSPPRPLPTFDGTISEPNPTLVPARRPDGHPRHRHRAGRQRRDRRLTSTPASFPSSLSSYAQYIRPDAGTRLTRPPAATSGHRGSRRGQHRAGHQHQPPARPVPASTTSGPAACCSPLPGTDSGYYVARVIASSTRAATSPTRPIPTPSCPFVVDDTAADRHVHVTRRPARSSRSLTNGGVSSRSSPTRTST